MLIEVIFQNKKNEQAKSFGAQVEKEAKITGIAYDQKTEPAHYYEQALAQSFSRKAVC